MSPPAMGHAAGKPAPWPHGESERWRDRLLAVV